MYFLICIACKRRGRTRNKQDREVQLGNLSRKWTFCKATVFGKEEQGCGAGEERGGEASAVLLIPTATSTAAVTGLLYDAASGRETWTRR